MSQYQPQPKRFKPAPFSLGRETYQSIPDEEFPPIENNLPSYPSALARDESRLHPYCAFLYFAAFLFAVSFCYAVVALTQSFSCLGPPYLYITHKGSRNILKFSRDGCLIHEKVLWGVSNQNSDLRGMAIGTYQGKEALYVADSNDEQSGVILYGECFQSTSLRPYISRVVNKQVNAGAQHAYSIAIDELTEDIYASFQNTDVILRFHLPEDSSSGSSRDNNYEFLPVGLSEHLQPLFLPSHKQKKSGSSDNSNDNSGDGTTDDANGSNLRSSNPSTGNEEEDDSSSPGDDDGHSTVSRHVTFIQNDTNKTTRRTKKTKKWMTMMNQHQQSNKLQQQQPKQTAVKNASSSSSSPSSSPSSYNYYNGTFVQFGLPGLHSSKERGVRSIVWVKNSSELWIANEDLDGVIVVNREGQLIHTIPVGKPIGLYSPRTILDDDKHSHNTSTVNNNNNNFNHLMFVGSKTSSSSSKKNGIIYAIDIYNYTIWNQYQYIGMKHPTGITSHKDVLFVADQTKNMVVTFNIMTTRMIRPIIMANKIDGEIEQMIISQC